jgi:hypothetical protein
MVYYFNGRKLQIGLSTHETENEKIVCTRVGILDGVSILIPDRDSETIEATNRINILGGDWIVVLERDGRTSLGENTRERATKIAHGRLSFIDIRSSIVEDGVQFLDGHVAVFGGDIGVDASGEKSSLNNIFERLLKIAREGVRAILSNCVDRHSVVLIVEIWNSLSGRSDESHL